MNPKALVFAGYVFVFGRAKFFKNIGYRFHTSIVAISRVKISKEIGELSYEIQLRYTQDFLCYMFIDVLVDQPDSINFFSLKVLQYIGFPGNAVTFLGILAVFYANADFVEFITDLFAD